MKYLKTFEHLQNPEIGDYVIIKTKSTDPVVKEFINTTIGEIFFVKENKIKVKYDNVPTILQNWFGYSHNENKYYRNFLIDQIVNISKSKEELKLILQKRSYNL